VSDLRRIAAGWERQPRPARLSEPHQIPQFYALLTQNAHRTVRVARCAGAGWSRRSGPYLAIGLDVYDTSRPRRLGAGDDAAVDRRADAGRLPVSTVAMSDQ